MNECRADYSESSQLDSSPSRSRPRRLALPQEVLNRGRSVRASLATSHAKAPPDEDLLLDFVSQQAMVASMLDDAVVQVLVRMGAAFDDARALLTVSKALAELVGLGGAVQRRIESALTTAASLRAQRRFLSSDVPTEGLPR